MEALTRREILAVLSSMGIDLPPATKLSDEALDKRLKQALIAAQLFSHLKITLPLDPTSLSAWPATKDNKPNSVYNAIRRGNLAEAAANYAAKLQGKDGLSELFVNAVMDLRQTLMSLTNTWDNGYRWCVIQDPDSENCAINVRMLSVYELDEKTPVVVLLYQSVTKANPYPGLRWIEAQLEKSDDKCVLINIKATELEQKLILKLLSVNAKYLAGTFKPKKEPVEDTFNVSFLLPFGPLSYEDIGKLNADTGCVLCGKKTSSRCAQCQSVSYCGQGCQHADWPNHKRVCRPLAGGTWRTLRFANIVPGLEHMHMAMVNRFGFNGSPTSAIQSPEDYTVAPPNVHGSKTFLTKIQIGVAGNTGNMMIYDRQRTFKTVFFVKQTDPKLFEDMKNEMQGPRGGHHGVKMYRFAKRVSDWELSICLDKEPQTQIKW